MFVLFQLITSYSVNQLWSMINTQQIVVMIPLFKLRNIPLVTQAVFNVLMTIAAFDILPDEWMYGSWNFLLGLDDDQVPDALNKNFEDVGFETLWSVHNLGSLALPIFSFPILAIIDVLLRPFSNVP